jgi:hypothetical protein
VVPVVDDAGIIRALSLVPRGRSSATIRPWEAVG